MAQVQLSWNQFKDAIAAQSLIIHYLDLDSNYFIYAWYGSNSQFELSCIIAQDEGEAQTDFDENYKAGAVVI